jgi:electron transport complex protein RnfB
MIGIIIMTSLGLILSLLLVNLDAYLNKDLPLEKEYENLLPGYNCGACGFSSCPGMAKAMLEDPLNYKKCRPLRGDALREMETYLRKIKKVK